MPLGVITARRQLKFHRLRRLSTNRCSCGRADESDRKWTPIAGRWAGNHVAWGNSDWFASRQLRAAIFKFAEEGVRAMPW